VPHEHDDVHGRQQERGIDDGQVPRRQREPAADASEQE
jgi:hypothetical protein